MQQIDWTTITHEYARACAISFYAAQADVEQRRRANGDDEAARWFTRFLAGESIAWSTRCDVALLPSPAFDALVVAALERLAFENARSAETARRANLKDDAKFFQRAANSYSRALEEWLAGTRPTRTEAGNYLLPSRSGGAAHLLTLDGDWICSCAAGASDHWAKALVIALEVASDDLDRFDDDGAFVVDAPEPGPASPAAPAVMLPANTTDEDVQTARQALIHRLTQARARKMREAA